MALKLGKCRLCLKLGDFYSIFSVDSSVQLAEMAMACAQVKIYEGDGLPDKVCGECVEKLSSAHIFKQQCERSDQELRRNYVAPQGFSQTPPPPNRQSSDSGYSNRTDASFQPKNVVQPEEPPGPSSSTGSNRKRKRMEAGKTSKNLLQESFSMKVASPAPSDYSRPKTPDKRPRYEQDSDYEYSGPNDSDSESEVKCSKCDRTFQTKRSLAQHRRVHSRDDRNSLRADALVDIPSPAVAASATPAAPSPTLDELACPTCGKTFKLQIMLKRHAILCCDAAATADLVDEPASRDRLTCTICNAHFKATPNLAKHMRVVHAAVLQESPAEMSGDRDVVPCPCIFCSTSFTNYHNYVAHFNSCPDHKKLSVYHCTLCDSQVSFKGNYFRHLKDKHFGVPPRKSTTVIEEEEGNFECRICSQKLANQDLLITHLAAHMSNVYGSQTAGEGSGVSTLEDAVSLNSELSGSGRQPQTCPYCDKGFTYRKSLNSHIQTKHSATGVQVKSEPPEATVYRDTDPEEEDEWSQGETDNTCDICEKQFSYRKTLLHHKRTKHPVTSGHKISKVNYSKCEVKCLHCDVTMLAGEIKPHNQVHINASIKPKCVYTCSECGNTYKGSHPLRNHIKLVHRLGRTESTNEKYQVTDVANFCEVVVTKTEPMDTLQGHNDYRSVPGEAIDGMKPIVDLSGFTCPICNKKMATLISLKRHINWHNNVGNNIQKKIQCKICNLDFRFNSHYKLHMKEHYFDTNLDPKFLTCSICNRKSKHLRAAQSHSLWHKQTRFSNKDYQCSICKRVFQYRKVYLSHMAVHFKKGESIETAEVEANSQTKPGTGSGEEHKCPHCQKILDSANSLKCHVSWHRSKSSLFGTRYECEICRLQFTNKRRHELHLRSHYEDEAGPYKCPVCGKGYSHEGYFQRHVKGHNFDHQSHLKKRQKLREIRQKKVQCPICCRYYPDLLHLVRHIRRSHPQSKMLKPDPDAPPEKVYSCKLCAKIFLDEKRLQFHEEAHLRKPMHFRCTFCGHKNISRKNHNLHVKSHLVKKYHEQPLECRHCDEKFVLGYALHHHLRDAHGINETWAETAPAERPFGPLQERQCSLCYKVLASRANYERHIDYHNSLRCNYCFEYFNGKVFLEGHLAFSCEKRRLIGDTEVHPKRIKCSECYKAFHLQVKLECHMWTQHGTRDFQRTVSSKLELVCDYCFRVFENEDALAGHKLYHRTIGYYGCLYCKRKFNTVTLYRKHKNHHFAQLCVDNPVKCEHCDEKFDWFRDCIYHMRDEHGDDKDWIIMPKESVEEECNICHKRFFNLHRHLRYHEENRCRKCREYFYSRTDFDAHLCAVESDDEEVRYADDGTPRAYEECDFCFKPLSKSNSKSLHDSIHKMSGSISCRFCPNKFKTIDAFNIHSFTHRNRKYKKNPLTCHLCREKFVAYGPFMRHIRGVHKVHDKMHYRAPLVAEPCVVCHQSFPNLHNHYRAHLQHRCPNCSKYFTSNRTFLRHACDKEDDDPLKVFTCEENLPLLINSYVPKEDVYVAKYYGQQEAEDGQEAVEVEPIESIEQVQPFSEVVPVISGVTSLNAPPKTNGQTEDSDDDCVVILVEGNEPPGPVTVCLDD